MSKILDYFKNYWMGDLEACDKIYNISGWKRDLPDFRDKQFKSLLSSPLFSIEIKKYVDLRPKMSPVEDQGRIGSCTAQALVGCMEYLDNINTNGYDDYSRLFVYYNEREMEGTINSDSGAMLRDGIKSLVTYGVCKEKLWPYIEGKFTKRPPVNCYEDAIKTTVTSYHRLDNTKINELKQCLSSGFPFVFGFSVYNNFMSDEVARTGIMPMPGRKDRTNSGHAVAGIGYDDDRRVFIIRNSWGIDWGDKGYFYMPYDFITNPNLADDFWFIDNGNFS